MTRSDTRGQRGARLRALSDAATQSQLQPDLPDAIATWLGRLCLLQTVPFRFIVPDARMLPIESIRFFYIDQNWIDSMVDGAVSIGKATSRDDAQHQALRTTIRDASAAAMRRVRSKNAAVTAADSEPPGILTGLLIRSELVAGWPGLEVHPYAQYDGNQPAEPLQILRMDRIAPSVLLCIFDGIAACTDISEPREALHFAATKLDPTLINNARVLDVSTLAQQLRTTSPAFLAWQMLQSTLSQRFLLQPFMLSADTQAITAGQTVTLSWWATSAVTDGAITTSDRTLTYQIPATALASGTYPISPAQTATYTLTCHIAGSAHISTITITVTPASQPG